MYVPCPVSPAGYAIPNFVTRNPLRACLLPSNGGCEWHSGHGRPGALTFTWSVTSVAPDQAVVAQFASAGRHRVEVPPEKGTKCTLLHPSHTSSRTGRSCYQDIWVI